ncbi:Rrf2 family transcriptional regulator [bacterium]|jgi:Rrf2 family protein|nr:Rrf2 family transcriptional regulator [bacterium]MBT4251244.1 Rrf2 family transcriptional regulator [bacterium]MBT4598375.1 Rrf2 family transcriptional regulator [bacterium]MBT6754208.1 Rrf2 family transcriptional regulator [bacterium]MBT7038021.1 Rrf2 family transcriptional regulator [bacterium]
MKFSKSSTYGLRAMARLAKYWEVEFISVTEISLREGISKKYLEQIFTKLKNANLVESGKGRQGGYRLLQKPEEINVYEIVNVLEGGVSPSNCLAHDGEFICEKKDKCGVVSLLAEIQGVTRDILTKTSLRDVERNHK